MPESFKTQRYEDRQSGKLGPAEYVSKHVVWLFLPLAGFAAGLGLRKIIKLPFLEEVGNPINRLVLGKDKYKAFQEMASQSSGYVMRRAEAFGLGLGSLYGAFRLWRANTTEQLEVEKINHAVTALRGLESPSAYLENENEQLRQQIRFSDKHASQSATHVEKLAANQEVQVEAQR